MIILLGVGMGIWIGRLYWYMESWRLFHLAFGAWILDWIDRDYSQTFAYK